MKHSEDYRRGYERGYNAGYHAGRRRLQDASRLRVIRWTCVACRGNGVVVALKGDEQRRIVISHEAQQPRSDRRDRCLSQEFGWAERRARYAEVEPGVYER